MKLRSSHWLIAGAIVAGWSPAVGARDPGPVRCVAPNPALTAAVGDGGCSVLLIGRDKILTAAHCADTRRFQLSAVTFSSGAYRERIAVTRCTQHPRFDGMNADFDLAVCQLERKVAAITPIGLAAPEATARQDFVCVVGFRGNASRRNRVMRPGRIKQLTSEHTARLDLETCVGDSGSPVFLARNRDWQAFALVSGGDAASSTCSRLTTATRLSPSLDWIRAQAETP